MAVSMDIWWVIITWLKLKWKFLRSLFLELFSIVDYVSLYFLRYPSYLSNYLLLVFKISFCHKVNCEKTFNYTEQYNLKYSEAECTMLKKIVRHLEYLDIFFQAVASKWQSHRQLLVLSVCFSWVALKRYTSGITMQRYNSMLSSSIILIFPSELIIHTDNLMIFLGDSRLVETVCIV